MFFNVALYYYYSIKYWKYISVPIFYIFDYFFGPFEIKEIYSTNKILFAKDKWQE